MLTLGFKGNEKPSEHVADPAALRGETPGRFVVEDVPDEAAEALAARDLSTHDLDASPDDSAPGLVALGTDHDAADLEPTSGQSGWAEGEREALLAPAPARPGDDTTATYPGRIGGKGRQKLPMALVGTLVVLFAGTAWLFSAYRQGWISPPSVTGTDAPAETGDSAVASDTATGPVVLPDSERLADARRPRSSSPARSIRERQAERLETDPTPRPAPNTAPPVASDDNASAPFDAFDTGLALPPAETSAETTNTQLAGIAPRVSTAEQLDAIIAEADARRPTTADSDPEPEPLTPERPLAADNASESFVWSGITVGNDDTVFTATTEPTESSDEAETLAGSVADPTNEANAPVDATNTATLVAVTPRVENLRPEPQPAPAAANPALADADRRVAFLVDISGTMVDSMPQLRRHLADAIDRLGPDTAFTVLLFRQGEVVELPPIGLRMASASARTAALRWLNDDLRDGAGALELGGRSDPTDALRTALTYGASDLVVLSDNALGRRAKANGGDLGLLDLTDTLRDRQGLTVHTVQFNYRDDRQLLRRLAERFEGTHEFVEEVLDASPDGLEPLSLIDALR